MTGIDLTDESFTLSAVALAVAFDLMTALVARLKGRSLVAWWLYGTFMPPFKLFHAMLMAPKRQSPKKFGASPGARRRCPHCGEAIKPDLDVCPECWRALPVDDVAP